MLERASWCSCGSQAVAPVPAVYQALGLFSRPLEDSMSWQVVRSVAPHRTEELNRTPEALESVPLARPKWEYCYRLGFPLQEKKRMLVVFSLLCWNSNADLTWPARPQWREEQLERWGSENWAEALFYLLFPFFSHLLSFSLFSFFFFFRPASTYRTHGSLAAQQ